jgi:multisubunit Na+/H+ antiporter MnhC subunit
LLAFAGEVKNLQHGLVDESDRMEEREASPVTTAFVLTTFCVG